MANFEEILNKPASEFKPPQALPVGTYHCLVDGPPEPGKSSQKQTDYLRFKFRVLGVGRDVDPAQAAEQQVIGKNIFNDYYITDGATYRLTEMLMDHLDIEDKPIKQMLAEAPGKQIMVMLKHEMSPDGKRVFHRVANTAHV